MGQRCFGSKSRTYTMLGKWSWCHNWSVFVNLEKRLIFKRRYHLCCNEWQLQYITSSNGSFAMLTSWNSRQSFRYNCTPVLHYILDNAIHTFDWVSPWVVLRTNTRISTPANTQTAGNVNFFHRASAWTETFTQADVVDRQDWEIRTCAHMKTHTLLVFIPSGVELLISWAGSLLFTLSSPSVLYFSWTLPLLCPLLSVQCPILSYQLLLLVGCDNPIWLVTRFMHLKHDQFKTILRWV